MSLLSETGLEEYARQCTLQRRRYEDCLQQAQRNDYSQEAARTGAVAQAADVKAGSDSPADRCIEQGTESCMVELLEMPVDPLVWQDRNSVLSETKNTVTEEYQWQSDRSQRSHQNITNPVGRSTNPISYGAP